MSAIRTYSGSWTGEKQNAWIAAIENFAEHPWAVVGYKGQTVAAFPENFPGHYFHVASCSDRAYAEHIVAIHNAAIGKEPNNA